MKYVLLILTLAQMMGGHVPPVPMTPAQFSSARIGQNVQIAVQVTGRNRETVSGELLRQKTPAVSLRTGRHITLYFPDGTPTVMGTAAQVQPGAVLFVYGVLTKPGFVDVKRLVIDSRFVHVASP